MADHPYNFQRGPVRSEEPVADASLLVVQPEVDPRAHMPIVWDQGSLGSCTANAVGAAVEYDILLDAPQLTGSHRPRPSRLFVYYGERMLEGTLGQGDTGAYGHDAFRFMAEYGWVREHEWPYVIGRFEERPPDNVWEAAKGRLLKKPVKQVPQTEDAIRAVLSNRQTVAFGFTVYESFEEPSVLQSGVVPMPSKGEQVLGGHEVLACGYLESHPDHVLVRNSWGHDVYLDAPGADVYGGGYFLMPWQYLLDADLASDLRTIVRPL